MLKHSPPSWTDFQPVPFAFTCSPLTLTLWQAPSVFITWRLADWSSVMQTFIRGRFANEAALIALDELNLYREDYFFPLQDCKWQRRRRTECKFSPRWHLFFCLPRNRTLISLLFNDNERQNEWNLGVEEFTKSRVWFSLWCCVQGHRNIG